jgi:predicted nucleic acid-binding protein
LALNGKLVPLYNADIMAEYRLVLARPKFAFQPARIAALLDWLESEGDFVNADPCRIPFPDEADRKFYEVAVSGHAGALITGNNAPFPALPLVVSPVAFLAQY